MCAQLKILVQERFPVQMNITPGNIKPGWIDAVANPEAITSLFDAIPTLKLVHHIFLNREGPALEITVDLNEFPARPPKKWHKDFNTSQIKIRFEGIKGLTINEWGTKNLIDYSSVLMEDNFHFIVIKGSDLDISFRARIGMIVGVSGYCDT